MSKCAYLGYIILSYVTIILFFFALVFPLDIKAILIAVSADKPLSVEVIHEVEFIGWAVAGMAISSLAVGYLVHLFSKRNRWNEPRKKAVFALLNALSIGFATGVFAVYAAIMHNPQGESIAADGTVDVIFFALVFFSWVIFVAFVVLAAEALAALVLYSWRLLLPAASVDG